MYETADSGMTFGIGCDVQDAVGTQQLMSMLKVTPAALSSVAGVSARNKHGNFLNT
jgi:hypothetical protein